METLICYLSYDRNVFFYFFSCRSFSPSKEIIRNRRSLIRVSIREPNAPFDVDRFRRLRSCFRSRGISANYRTREQNIFV